MKRVAVAEDAIRMRRRKPARKLHEMLFHPFAIQAARFERVIRQNHFAFRRDFLRVPIEKPPPQNFRRVLRHRNDDGLPHVAE